MKRNLCILFCAALLAVPAFSAVSIDGFGRAVYSVLACNDGSTLKTAGGTSWGMPYRVGFGVTGDFNFVGFHADIIAGKKTMNGGDERKLWVHLLDGILTITGGTLQDNTLRSDACFGMYDWLRGGLGNSGEDFTFKRINVTGLCFAFRPANEIYITVGLPFSLNGATDLIDTYGKIQAAIGYSINDRMQIKVGYFGNLKDDKGLTNIKIIKDGETIADTDIKVASVNGFGNIGFDIDISPELFLSAGIFSNSAFNSFTGNVYVRQSRHPLTLHGMVSMEFGKGFEIGVGTGIDYLIGNGMLFQIDLRTENLVEKSGQELIALAGLSKAFANGIVGIGFELGLNTNIATIEGPKKANDVSFAVPVKLQYNF